MAEPVRQTIDSAMMQRIAKALDEGLGGLGFCLLVFPMNEAINGRVNYVSNARREDMLVALKEFTARHEGRVTDETGHA